MAYDKEQILELAKEAIIENNLVFITEVISYLPIVSSTFYLWEMEKSEILKELLIKNAVNLKVELRSKWRKSDAPALQLALMKLVSTPDELKQLSMTYVSSEVKTVEDIDYSKLSNEALKEIANAKIKS